MCGIAGIVSTESNFELFDSCERMKGRLMHRGPDDSGMLFSDKNHVGLVHTRLSILDLSSAGHQPMSTPDGRHTIVFNGEIYNFEDLRKELEAQGVLFSSSSDTEVILRMFERYGRECVIRFEGMFAFAIWDRTNEELFLARGPLGIKPLYVWQVGDSFAFASELRAILEAKLAPAVLNGSAVHDFLVWGTPQEPETLVSGISMLPPGHYLTWKQGKVIVSPYWQIEFLHADASYNESVNVCRSVLVDSVRRHFVSDVPVGIFLSGGLDSTAILALAKENGIDDIHTFCISFDEKMFSEGDVASRTAKHFGTTHHEWKMSSKDALMLLPEYLEAVDQPSIDGFNVFCVSKFARREGIKVVLSGLGGDELFGSYPSFALVPKLLRWHKRFQGVRGIQMAAGAVMGGLPFGNRVRRLGQFLSSVGSAACAYQSTRSIFSSTEANQLRAAFFPGLAGQEAQNESNQSASGFSNVGDQVSYMEMTRYMLNQLLRDSDVMSMANGLELRVPFVDSRLVSLLGRIPTDHRLATGKKILVDAVPEIPEWVRNRSKQGFSFPLRDWIADFWQKEIERVRKKSPVPISTWYQAWALISLERFCELNIPNNVGQYEISGLTGTR